MVPDLLVAGLLLASATDLLPQEPPKPTGSRHEAHATPAACAAGSRHASQSALLEAHARYAALPPFSLARLRPAPDAAHDGPARERDALPCKS